MAYGTIIKKSEINQIVRLKMYTAQENKQKCIYLENFLLTKCENLMA